MTELRTPLIRTKLNAPRLSRQLVARPRLFREIDILTLLAERLSNKEIGSKLFISGSTVKRHTANTYEKLQVHDRREAVLRARNAGVLGQGPERSF